MKHIVVLAIVLLCLVALLSTVGENHAASAAGIDQVATSTVTFESFLTSLSSPEQIFNGPFTVLSTTGTNLPCELWVVNFNATTGQYLSGSFNSDSPVSFFVVQQASYQNWVKADTCGNAGDAIASQLIATSYSFNGVAIPSSGTWAIVIVNSSNARDAGGYLAAYLTTVPYTTTFPTTVPYPVTQPLTGTITMTTTSTVFGGQPVAGFPVPSIILGIIVGLVAVIMLRRRNHD